jgi:Protein of unknown function (DUF2997)
MKKIVITFEQNGNSSIEAFGFSGSDCLAATKSFEEALGKVGSRKMKSGGDDDVSQKTRVNQ